MYNANWYQFWSKIDPLLTFEKRSVGKFVMFSTSTQGVSHGCNMFGIAMVDTGGDIPGATHSYGT